MTREMITLFGEQFDAHPHKPTVAGPATDAMTAGPYALFAWFDRATQQWGAPFGVVDGNGLMVCGHIRSVAVAKAVRDALNAASPSGTELTPGNQA